MALLYFQLFYPPLETVVMLNVLPLARNISNFNLSTGELKQEELQIARRVACM